MKKICLLAFAFLLFLLSFNISFAKSDLAAAQTTTPSPEPEVNYELPYPGLLPDSPLYFLRVIRDRIVGLLISDPLKKSEFNLLQADKRLNAGIYLINSAGKNDKKIALAFSTISKAENYFEEAINKIKEAKNQGKDVVGMEGRLTQSLKKHKQELKVLMEEVGANFKSSFESELKRIANFEQRLD